MTKTFKNFTVLALGAFALYALSAQRGLGWGDSGEFQYRILRLSDGLLSGCDSFATAHPLYVALAKLLCSTPFEVTLLSAFFGALSVAGVYCCTKSLPSAVLFGLSHAVWWLSCVAEVYTMSLFFLVAEVFLLGRFMLKDNRWGAALFFVNGLHLTLHNVALLSLPVYALAALFKLRKTPLKFRVVFCVAVALFWAAGSSYWLFAFFERGAKDVLFGGYGAEAAGMLPKRWSVAAFNWALSAVSFVVPAFLFKKALKVSSSPAAEVVQMRLIYGALFSVHFLFWVRYFIVSQFTFVLAPLFLFWMIVSTWEFPVKKWVALLVVQLLLPVAVYQVLRQIPVPEWRRSLHPFREEAAYFAFPWKFNDDSADRCAAMIPGEWDGYPGSRKDNGK